MCQALFWLFKIDGLILSLQHPSTVGISWYSFYRGRQWHIKSLSHLPKVHISSEWGARVKTQAI